MIMDMETIPGRAVLKGAVQRQLFCQVTQQVLDVKRAVACEIYFPSGNVATIVVTADAWPQIKDGFPEMVADGTATKVEIYDGRELFGRKARR